jgi:hypothetical protein
MAETLHIEETTSTLLHFTTPLYYPYPARQDLPQQALNLSPFSSLATVPMKYKNTTTG